MYAVYDQRNLRMLARQILAKTRNSPNIIARQNLLIYSMVCSDTYPRGIMQRTIQAKADNGAAHFDGRKPHNAQPHFFSRKHKWITNNGHACGITQMVERSALRELSYRSKYMYVCTLTQAGLCWGIIRTCSREVTWRISLTVQMTRHLTPLRFHSET